MSKLMHLDTGEVLGHKVAWKKMPFNTRRLFHPFKKKHQLIFFQDFTSPNIYGCVLKDKGVVME